MKIIPEVKPLQRFLALVIVVIPGALAVVGITWMRDALFSIYHTPIHSILFQLGIGLLFCIIGVVFIASFIHYRDRKRNYRANRKPF